MDNNGSARPRQSTEQAYRRQINRVIVYMRQRAAEPLRLEELAQVAGFSPYHFHRIFSAFTGQTLGEFLRELRLEAAAERLVVSETPITAIALDSGYATPAAFGKAFKQAYGLTPSEFRQRGLLSAGQRAPGELPYLKQRRIPMKPEIRTLPDLRVLYARATGSENGDFTQAANRAFGTLMKYLDQHQLQGAWSMCMGICPDDPDETPAEQARYDAGVVLKPEVSAVPGEGVALTTLPAGRYAVFTHVGAYSQLGKTWNAIYTNWAPGSGATLRDVAPFEVYLDDQGRVPEAELRTEIYIPIV